MISSTHTHSAPFANANFGTPQELTYQKKLIAGITEAIVQAVKNQATRQGRLVGFTIFPDEVFNRRWFLKAGTVPTNPFGKDTDIVKMNPGNSNLINPAGPTDPEVSVLYIENAAGQPLSVFANYSLHYVGNTGGQMSADYFRRIRPAHAGSAGKVRPTTLSPCCPTAQVAISTISISGIGVPAASLSSRSGSSPAKPRTPPIARLVKSTRKPTIRNSACFSGRSP